MMIYHVVTSHPEIHCPKSQQQWTNSTKDNKTPRNDIIYSREDIDYIHLLLGTAHCRPEIRTTMSLGQCGLRCVNYSDSPGCSLSPGKQTLPCESSRQRTGLRCHIFQITRHRLLSRRILGGEAIKAEIGTIYTILGLISCPQSGGVGSHHCKLRGRSTTMRIYHSQEKTIGAANERTIFPLPV